MRHPVSVHRDCRETSQPDDFSLFQSQELRSQERRSNTKTSIKAQSHPKRRDCLRPKDRQAPSREEARDCLGQRLPVYPPFPASWQIGASPCNTFPPPCLKFRTSGFPCLRQAGPVRLQTGIQPRPSLATTGLSARSAFTHPLSTKICSACLSPPCRLSHPSGPNGWLFLHGSY